jgi:DNA-binding response OmpR family regulator
MKILVIEDDSDLCLEIVEYLERRSHQVSGCRTVAAARQALAAGKAPFEAVLCDVGLPDGDGLRFCIESMAEMPGSRWILMSGAHDVERLQRELTGLETRLMVLEKPLPAKLLRQALECA